jgi:hypothetical protein
MLTTLRSNTAIHEHCGNLCNGIRYLMGGAGDYRFVPCPLTNPCPLLPYIGKSREGMESPHSGKLQRPQCEFMGVVPHPASPAYRLVWDLQSGTVVKWSCGCHQFSFGGRPYWVNRCEGLEDVEPPRTHEHAALPDAPQEYRLGGEEDESLASCVDDECGNPATPGEFCDECQSRWEDEQRAKATAAEGRPRAINKQRGF